MSFEFNSTQTTSSSATSLSSNSRVFDFEGLEESLVDNELNESIGSEDERDECDDEDNCDVNDHNDDCDHNHSLTTFDAIREALIRDSNNRSEDDLDAIQRFLTFISNNNHKKENNNRNQILRKDFKTQRLFAKHFVLAEIESRDTRVLTDGERLDAYCVVACGSLRHVMPISGVHNDSSGGDHDPDVHVDHESQTRTRYLAVGDEFGAAVDDRVVCGEIFTNEDFVWVLCVPHVIFDEICESNEKSFKTIKDEISGNIVEIRSAHNDGELMRATNERLFHLLFSTHDVNDSDTTRDGDNFLNDFLLTFRIWNSRDLTFDKEKNDCDVISELMARIVDNLKKEKNLEKNIRIVLLWIQNHFQDFSFSNSKQLLSEFESNLKSKIHKTLFYLSLSSKSRERHVTLTRSDRTSPLPFTLIGGYECSSRLFVSEVLDDCDVDLARCDRLISINGFDCHSMEVKKALELCRNSTHVSIVVKFDPNLFHLLLDGQISRNSETKRHFIRAESELQLNPMSATQSLLSLTNNNNKIMTSASQLSSQSLMTTNNKNDWKQKVKQIVNNVVMTTTQHNNHKTASATSATSLLRNNNNCATTPTTQTSSTTETEVIKIYYENDFRYLPIHVTTTARECIQLALIEFQLTSFSSRDFALFEYKIIDKTTQTSAVKRLSDNFQNLNKNLSLNARIYLKCISGGTGTQPLLNAETEITKALLRESHEDSLLRLDADAIARELTSRDFELFCRIESQQFVYDLKGIENRIKELKEFEEKTNKEMFWTINEILIYEKKCDKSIKKMIKIAQKLRALNNYNSLFALLSGLSHLSVTRLKSFWEKIPQKSIQKFQKLQQLLDPSKNFGNFRSELRKTFPPIIPFFPLVKKDLSFIYLANQTFIECEKNQILINWEKMKLLSQKIREIQLMTTQTPNTTTRTHFNANNNDNNCNEILSNSNYKKIWEKQRMKKRVQHFLDKSFSQIISDENLLLEKSLKCDPTQTSSQSFTTRSSISVSSSQSSSAVMPSPTPSSHSSSPSLSSSTTNSSDVQSSRDSNAIQRTRFGVRDDNGLRKLLALSDNCVAIHAHPIPNSQNSHFFQTNNNSFNTHFNTNSAKFYGNRVAVAVNGFVGRQMTSQSLPQELPHESSSVTSLRRLEQLQQLSRFRDQFSRSSTTQTSSGVELPFGHCVQRLSRPLIPPNYDQTIQRMKKKSKKQFEENVV